MIDLAPFANRLRKNLKHWRKWARRRNISCFRVYDRDLPEFPLAIDVYHDQAHVQTYVTRWEASEDDEAIWEQGVRTTVADSFALAPETLAFKTRQRQRGAAQYEKTGLTGSDFIVQEAGLSFWVNLHTYLDTGLFLDHRETRALARNLAQGRRVLNLFAYTGSFTVYAAAGGARESLTVDLSNTYQDWARRNFTLNGLDPRSHRLLRADVLSWLAEASKTQSQYDLIILDPPSFSNSKKMLRSFDIQRDHAIIINQCLQLLGRTGILIFATNRRGFRLSTTDIRTDQITELTASTVPDDFRRSKPHRCWQIGPSQGD